MENNDDMRHRFNSIWEERRRPPKLTENWVYHEEWAKGRTQYLTFLIRIKESSIIEQVSRIQEKLLQFPCVDPFPTEYLQLTEMERTVIFTLSEEGPLSGYDFHLRAPRAPTRTPMRLRPPVLI